MQRELGCSECRNHSPNFALTRRHQRTPGQPAGFTGLALRPGCQRGWAYEPRGNSPMSLSQFANEPLDARFELRFDPDVQILMRLLGAFALRGVMPRDLQLQSHADLAHLIVNARLGAHDAQVLATRLAQGFGVVDVDWRAQAPADVVLNAG